MPHRGGSVCALALAACAAWPAHAGQGSFSGGVALSTQLVDRGQAVSPATPILQGSVAWAANGWMLGLSGSARFNAPAGHFVEATAQAARYWTLSSDWSMQAGALYYRYPPHLKYPARQRYFDRMEVGVHWTWRDVLTFGVSSMSTVHQQRQHWREAVDATFRWPLTRYLSLSVGAGVAHALTPSYQRYSYGQAGLAWTQGAWRFEVVRLASDQKPGWNPAYPKAEPWVATLLWSF